MGLVFFYLLTNYSNPITIESNFKFDKFYLKCNINLELLEGRKLRNPSTSSIFAVQLIKGMIQRRPNERSSISDCIEHPYFWSNWKYIEFVKVLVADISEFDLEDQINNHSKSIIGNDWSQTLDFVPAPLYAAKSITGCIYSLSKVYQKDHDLNLISKVNDKFPQLLPHLFEIHNKFVANMNPQRDTSHKVSFKHFPDKPIGYGFAGATVYEGLFEKQKIAIKRISKRNTEEIRREMNIFLKIKTHPNIVQYFGTQHDTSFSFIGLEFCDCTLEQLIFDPKLEEFKLRLPDKEIMLQITEGLKELHKLNIGILFLNSLE